MIPVCEGVSSMARCFDTTTTLRLGRLRGQSPFLWGYATSCFGSVRQIPTRFICSMIGTNHNSPWFQEDGIADSAVAPINPEWVENVGSR